jgi:hypothetical protein
MLKVCSSDDCGWLTSTQFSEEKPCETLLSCDNPAPSCDDPALGCLEQKGIEQNRTEGKEENQQTIKKEKVEYSAEFEDFWKSYPRRIGKGEAWKSWKRIAPDQSLRERICASLAVQSQRKEWLKDGGQFIPHPSTWLNGARWLDEIQDSPNGYRITTPTGSFAGGES